MRRANAVVHAAAASGQRLYLTALVLCALVRVLRGAYELDRSAVATTVERIPATVQFEVEHKDAMYEAWGDYQAGTGDFADYVIGRRGKDAGCDHTATFARRLKASTLFRTLAT